MTSRRDDETGASLLLVIGLMLLMSLVGGAMIAGVRSGLSSRISLDDARDRQYAADGAIEQAIVDVRAGMENGKALDPCSGIKPIAAPPNDIAITIDCNYAPTLADGFWQRNVIFTASCTSNSPGSRCTNTDPIIRAQVNFESPSAVTLDSANVTKTFIQSWSVIQ